MDTVSSTPKLPAPSKLETDDLKRDIIKKRTITLDNKSKEE